MLSPFEFDLDFKDLPSVFIKQYLLSVEEPYYIICEGNSDHIWHCPQWLFPFFWFLTWFQIFFPETGKNVPTQLIITAGRDSADKIFHKWDRIFHFKQDRYFNAVMAYDEKQKAVVEKMGPFKALHIYWKIEFSPPNRITISSTKCCLKLGRLKLFLPIFLYPSVTAKETAINDETIYLDLIASHPWLGNIFGYAGTFSVRKVGN